MVNPKACLVIHPMRMPIKLALQHGVAHGVLLGLLDAEAYAGMGLYLAFKLLPYN